MFPLLRSIATRFTAATVATAVATFLGLLGLVAYQVDRSIERQRISLERISDANLARTLDADVQLAGTRLKFLFDDTKRRVVAISGRSDTISITSSRNVVAIWEKLGPAAAQADVDGLIVLDHEGKVTGASSDHADLIGLNRALAQSPMWDDIYQLLKSNRPDKPKVYSSIVPSPQFGSFVPGIRTDGISQVIFVPLFDDFGEVSGGLVALRALRARERLLQEFAEIGSLGLVVFHDDKVITRAAFDGKITPRINQDTRTGVTQDGLFIKRCGTPTPPLTICALKPIEELYSTQAELTRIGQKEERSLLRSIGIFGLGATVLFIASSMILSRQIASPLKRITKVVSSVAEGNYEDTVEGCDQVDEVGDIARAVVLLQGSVKERDNLRAEVQTSNEILKKQERELRKQNMLFDAALNNMSHGLCMFDADKRLIVSNARYLELFDLSPDQVKPGMRREELLSLQEEVSGFHFLDDEEVAESDLPPRDRTAAMMQLDNGRFILKTRQPLRDGGWVAIFEDVTERQRARDRLAHLASHDSLTDLPNRTLFLEHLNNAIRKRNREGGTFGILCLDLDEFKTINDSLGHPVGDVLLRQVASRLLRLAGDQQLVVRLGGDEFAVITGLESSASELDTLAKVIIEELSRPFHLSDHEIAVGVSIGIAVMADEGTNGDELFKQADMALYQAKADGRNTYRFFAEEMEALVSIRRELITNLRNAIENDELEVHYQPQIRLSDGSISGFEALMRWHHPERGMVSPAEFIPLAEETGLIVNLGDWILRQACKTAASWPEDICISVNISPRQLLSPTFGPTLVNVLATTGLSPPRLELEVTESVVLGDDTETLAKLHQAKSLGVRISMDDFGTGYSSLSCLRSFPFDKIKIDQSFVRNMMQSEDSRSIVQAIIELADSLKMTTTAEGVETEELVTVLGECGCTEAQGYYFGRPAPEAELVDLVDMHGDKPRLAASA